MTRCSLYQSGLSPRLVVNIRPITGQQLCSGKRYFGTLEGAWARVQGLLKKLARPVTSVWDDNSKKDN